MKLPKYMKLLLCAACGDVRALDVEEVTCRCGASSGRLLDDKFTAEICGDDAYAIGFNKRSISVALTAHIKNGDHHDEQGRNFSAYIIPENADSFRRRKSSSTIEVSEGYTNVFAALGCDDADEVFDDLERKRLDETLTKIITDKKVR